MDRPLDIAFHNMPSSPELEAEIRQHVERLNKLHDRMTACRVSVEALHQQHQTGNLYEVHVVMSLPGAHDLAVSHEPHRARERYAHPDVRVSLRTAFHAAERQLQEHKSKQRAAARSGG